MRPSHARQPSSSAGAPPAMAITPRTSPWKTMGTREFDARGATPSARASAEEAPRSSTAGDPEAMFPRVARSMDRPTKSLGDWLNHRLQRVSRVARSKRDPDDRVLAGERPDGCDRHMVDAVAIVDGHKRRGDVSEYPLALNDALEFNVLMSRRSRTKPRIRQSTRKNSAPEPTAITMPSSDACSMARSRLAAGTRSAAAASSANRRPVI